MKYCIPVKKNILYEVSQILLIKSVRDTSKLVRKEIINKNGKRQTVYVRFGTDKTEKKHITEPAENVGAFQRWFGNSVIKNTDDTPLVMYHATNNNFDTFQSGNSAGTIYFAFSERDAKKGARGKKNVMPVFLSVKNPVNNKDHPLNWYDAEDSGKVAQWKNQGFDGVFVKDESGVSVAVFSPKQIKSINNSGLYGENETNIYKAIRGVW